MIRFLKNVKEDSGYEIELSSFDIKAICYDIDIEKYSNLTFYELVPVLYEQIQRICTDSNYCSELTSVDGRERIFKDNQDKVGELKKILSEIESINYDLSKTSR